MKREDVAVRGVHKTTGYSHAAKAGGLLFVAGQVASYKQLRRLEVIEAIPKSPSGKILRRVLRDAAAQSPL